MPSPTINPESAINRLNVLHDNKYSYDQAKITTSRNKIQIGCPVHGLFWQKLHSHLQGQGCPKCANEERGKKYALTNEEFIRRARTTHGNKYDYSKVNYTLTEGLVEIICPEHGSFFQRAGLHLGGAGCVACGVVRRGQAFRSDTETFIAKARDTHGNKYGYDKVIYTTSDAKVVIHCPEHGDFEQGANSHLKGRGCPVCGGRLQSNTEEFVKKAIARHGNRYNYGEVEYIKAKLPVKIICPKHGLFSQQPNNHLTGSGCPLCKARCVPNTEEFIERAKKTHGDIYDYSKANYVDGISKVVIGCKTHGDFEQSASEHIRGRGCKKCAEALTGIPEQLTTEEFIRRAKAIHDDKCDYSQSEYINARTPIKIICPKHGSFLQLHTNHLKGTGCPTCNSSKGELFLSKIFTENNINFIPQFKIPNTSFRYRYDFYLPDHNLLIEFHGQQHYEPVDHFGGEERFQETQTRDAIKKSIARTLKYRFLEISYKAFLGLSEEVFIAKFLALLEQAKAKVTFVRKFS